MSAITPTSMSSRELLATAMPVLSGTSGGHHRKPGFLVLAGHWLVALTLAVLTVVAVAAVVGAVAVALAAAAAGGRRESHLRSSLDMLGLDAQCVRAC